MTEYVDKAVALSMHEPTKSNRHYQTDNLDDAYGQGWDDALCSIEHIPAADVTPVRHGRWKLTTHSFYRDTFDESCELCVYIVANCSECSGNHPNSYQVFSKTLHATDDTDDDFRFDQKAEEEKALLEFRNKKYEFAHYCPNCGAKMDGGAE